MLCRSTLRLGLAPLLTLLLLVTAATAAAQQPDLPRAQSHLDAARALINPDAGFSSVQLYSQLAPLEVQAQRPEKARELTHLVLGMMQADAPEKQSDYLYHLAQIYLAQDNTQEAINALSHYTKPRSLIDDLYLQAVHQTARRFGLQRAIDLAREAFPNVSNRRDVYCKLCYTLAFNGQADLAKEFIDVAMDLTEIYLKLDAYRFAAVGLHKAGDTEGGTAFLEDAFAQANAYNIVATRADMLIKLASAFHEIGRTDRARQLLELALQATEQIPADDYQRKTSFKNLALVYATLGDRDRALALLAQAPGTFGEDAVYKTIVEQDLAAGNLDRAKAFQDQRNLYFGNGFEVQAALATLDRGDAAAALAAFLKLSEDLVPGNWHRDAAAAFARQGQHTAIQALLAKTKDPSSRRDLHLGAAAGYLGEQ